MGNITTLTNYFKYLLLHVYSVQCIVYSVISVFKSDPNCPGRRSVQSNIEHYSTAPTFGIIALSACRKLLLLLMFVARWSSTEVRSPSTNGFRLNKHVIQF